MNADRRRRGEQRADRFHFIDVEKALPGELLCQLLEVSRPGYYTWAKRPPSRRSVADGVLTEQFKGFYDASGKTYWAPRIWLDLRPDDPRDSADLTGCRRRPRATFEARHAETTIGLAA